MALSGQQEEAAIFVAEDRLTDDEICTAVGLKSRRTLYGWKQQPEFGARVEALRAEFRARVRERGLAVYEERLDALNARWRLMHQILKERAAKFAGLDVPGASTGLMVPHLQMVKVWNAGVLVRRRQPRADDRGGGPDDSTADGSSAGPDWSISDLLERGVMPPGPGADESGGGGRTSGAGGSSADDASAPGDWQAIDNPRGELFSARRVVEVVEWSLDVPLLNELRRHEEAGRREELAYRERRASETEQRPKIRVHTIEVVRPAPALSAAGGEVSRETSDSTTDAA